MSTPSTAHSSTSMVLVALQIVCMVLLFLPFRDFLPPYSLAGWFGLLMVLGAIALAGWAFQVMGTGTFSVFPEPRAGGHLALSGPYRYVRHPMYGAVLLGGLGSLLMHLTLWHVVVFGVLVAVLVRKIRYEEHLLQLRHGDYERRTRGTARLLPGIW